MSKSEMRSTIQEDFRQFHHDNPWVFDKLVDMTRDLHQKGRKRFGIGMLWEVLRWNVAMGTITVDDNFKLNNNYRSRYVRLIIEKYPQYDCMFECRVLRSP